jgi:hypothetical protein
VDGRRKGRILMGTVNWKDAAIRAVKTFVQAFIVAVPSAAILAEDLDSVEKLLYGGLVAGGAAALAYIWNVLLTWSKS